jgi:hypothetical protein
MKRSRASQFQAARRPPKRKQPPPKIAIDPNNPKQIHSTAIREMVRHAKQHSLPPLTPLDAGFLLSMRILLEFLGPE